MTPEEARAWMASVVWEERLDEREQHCLLLRAQGLTLREIGATFDRSGERARHALAKARRKLSSSRTRRREETQGHGHT